MKKLFLTIVVAVLVLAAATTSVNAATTVSNAKAEVESTVTVTVDFGKAENADGTVTYNAEVLKFVSGPSVTFEPTAGTINFSMSQVGGLGKTTFTFTAVKAGTADVTVNVTNSQDATAVGTFTGKVEVAEKTKPVDPTPVDPTPVDPTPVDPTPETPDNGNQPTTPDNGNQQQPAQNNPAPAAPAAPVAAANPAPATNGMPTRLPQTGVNYAVVAMIALAVVAIVVATIKLNNK